MGLFSRRTKIYTPEEALKYANKNKGESYSFVEVPGGFQLISDTETKKRINNFQERRAQFKNQITENGMLQNSGVKNQLLNRVQDKSIDERYKAAEKYVAQNRQTEMDR